ncbi:aminotransferase class IV family protein [Amycolatopsis nigrescens]|uniref:aminotransferase class IV family protein n=1 Tax=Amycolatopsis nigrescens TaxID=381445 RepID=UPI001FE060FF|nr:aminotransferase class IV family protein [Amycolatopsis nigrescens]
MTRILTKVELNGRAATAEDLVRPALSNYGHFTAMQVRDGRVRGLAEHLTRLRRSTTALFGSELDPELVRAHLRHAVGEYGAFSVRVNIFSGTMDRADPAQPAAPDVLVSVDEPSEPASTPLRVRSAEYERVLPEVKHVGTFGLIHHIREARLAGFDDALFVDARGRITEGSVWNVGFFDGGTVVFPDAPALPGISLQLLRKGLRAKGVPVESREVRLSDLAGFDTTFVTNSATVGQPIASVDDVPLKLDPAHLAIVRDAYDSLPWDRI